MATYRVKIRPDLAEHQHDLRYDFLVTEDSVADVKANDDVTAAIEAVTEDFQDDNTMLKIYEWQGTVEDDRYYYQNEYSGLWKFVDRSAHAYVPDPLDTVMGWYRTDTGVAVTTASLGEITVDQALTVTYPTPAVALYISSQHAGDGPVFTVTDTSDNVVIDSGNFRPAQEITLSGEATQARLWRYRYRVSGAGLTVGALPPVTVTASIPQRTHGVQQYNAATASMTLTGTVVAAPMEGGGEGG